MPALPARGTVPKPKPDVVFRRLDEGGVLVDLSTNQIFELNHTATRVWELFAESYDPAIVVDLLAEEFEVDAETASEHLHALIKDLESEGLLER